MMAKLKYSQQIATTNKQSQIAGNQLMTLLFAIQKNKDQQFNKWVQKYHSKLKQQYHCEHLHQTILERYLRRNLLKLLRSVNNQSNPWQNNAYRGCKEMNLKIYPIGGYEVNQQGKYNSKALKKGNLSKNLLDLFLQIILQYLTKMEIGAIKDFMIKQVLEIQSTIFNCIFLKKCLVIPQLQRVVSNHFKQGEQICTILQKASDQLKEQVQQINSANGQIQGQKILQENTDNSSKSRLNSISNQTQCEIHQQRGKTISLKVTQEPNIGKPCCLCNTENEITCGKIIIIPNSIRKLQAHQLCLNNIYNPRQVEFDKIYLLFRTYECSVCKQPGASQICEKCNQKYHFPCYMNICQEGIIQCPCKQQ